MREFNIICPTCGHTAKSSEFHLSLADECFCPAGNGCEWFLLRTDDEDDSDEEEEG